MELTSEADYRIEESDDPRTLTGELISDTERAEQDKAQADTEAHLVKAYYDYFISLLYELGKVAYHFKILNKLKDGSKTAREISEKYDHGINFYRTNLKHYRATSLKLAEQYAIHAGYLDVDIWQDQDEMKTILNDLVLDAKKRVSVKNIAKRAKKRGQLLSIYEMFNRRKNSPSK